MEFNSRVVSFSSYVLSRIKLKVESEDQEMLVVSGGNGQWVEAKLSDGAFNQEVLRERSLVRIQYCVRGMAFSEGHCEGGEDKECVG